MRWDDSALGSSNTATESLNESNTDHHMDDCDMVAPASPVVSKTLEARKDAVKEETITTRRSSRTSFRPLQHFPGTPIEAGRKTSRFNPLRDDVESARPRLKRAALTNSAEPVPLDDQSDIDNGSLHDSITTSDTQTIRVILPENMEHSDTDQKSSGDAGRRGSDDRKPRSLASSESEIARPDESNDCSTSEREYPINGTIVVDNHSSLASLKRQHSSSSLSSELSDLSSMSSIASQESVSSTGSNTIHQLEACGMDNEVERQRIIRRALNLTRKWKTSWDLLERRIHANIKKQERARAARGQGTDTRRRR